MRYGIKKIIIPKKNEKDLQDIPKKYKEELTFIPVTTIDEVLDRVLVRKIKPLHGGKDDKTTGEKK